MSYKITLTDIDRDGPTSVTRQLADRFAAAIESGELEPGEKLPPTRALAEEAGVNHLTAARVYRRLAEEGYVTATVGPRHLRPHADAQRRRGARRRLAEPGPPRARAVVLGGVPGRRVRLRGRPQRHLARDGLARAQPLPHRAAGADHPRHPGRGGRRRLHLPDRGRPRATCASSWPSAGARSASRASPRRSSSPPAPSRRSTSPFARWSSRATPSPWSRPPTPACCRCCGPTAPA